MARDEAEMPRNVTERAQQAARDIKAASVTKYAGTTIATMKTLQTNLKELKFDPAMGQSDFKKEADAEKALAKRIEAVKAEAQRLRSDAVDAGLAEDAQKLEDGSRDLTTDHAEVTQAIQKQRRDRNLPSVTGTGGGRAMLPRPLSVGTAVGMTTTTSLNVN